MLSKIKSFAVDKKSNVDLPTVKNSSYYSSDSQEVTESKDELKVVRTINLEQMDE